MTVEDRRCAARVGITRAMQSNLRRLAYLTEALYELERSERAAQAQIEGHALVCPLNHEPNEPPGAELFPETPNGEAIAEAWPEEAL